MKHTLTTILAAALMLSSATAFAQDRPAERQKRQQKRIAEGIASGELNKREVKKIESKERALHKEVVKDRKDGPGLTRKERVKIEAQQDALSADIAKQKHDKQKQK